jgi:hypothetical protein
MGYIGNLTGDLRVAFYLVPACFLALAALIGVDWLQSMHGGNHGHRDAGPK